jgi:dTDP-4-amino-4,6-dideoxygalactose transaminase
MNREIPFFSFSKVPDVIREEWVEAVRGTIGSNQFVSGKFVRQFENEWAATIGVSESIGVANGLDGLLLALKALGVGQGDFVGVPSHTFIATWNAVKLAGAEPVCIDVDQRGLMDIKIHSNKVEGSHPCSHARHDG